MNTNAKRHGGVLISALIVVIVVVIMCLSVTQLLITSNGVARDNEDRMHALLLAESGLAIGFKQITNPVTFQTLADDTVIWHEQLASNREINVVKKTNDAGLPTLESTGIVEKTLILGGITRVSRTIEGVVGYSVASGSFPSGAFGMSALSVGGDFYSDSYDSSLGGYGGTNVGHHGDLGTNGAVTMNGASFYVDGNVSPGPGQEPVSRPGQITGSGAPLIAPVTITIPPYLVPANAIPLTTTPSTLGMGASTKDYHISSLSTSPHDTITVTGVVNLYVDGNIDLKGDIRLNNNNAILNIYQNSGTITINGGGTSNDMADVVIPAQTVSIPAGATITEQIVRTILKDGTNQTAPTISGSDQIVVNKQGNKIVSWTITTPANTVLTAPVTYTIPEHTEPGGGYPGHFNIISQTTSAVKLNGNSTYYGTIVAPNADVTINGTANKFGAIIGNNMILLGTGDFHYDLSAKSPGIISLAKLLSYRERLPREVKFCD